MTTLFTTSPNELRTRPFAEACRTDISTSKREQEKERLFDPNLKSDPLSLIDLTETQSKASSLRCSLSPPWPTWCHLAEGKRCVSSIYKCVQIAKLPTSLSYLLTVKFIIHFMFSFLVVWRENQYFSEHPRSRLRFPGRLLNQPYINSQHTIFLL